MPLVFPRVLIKGVKNVKKVTSGHPIVEECAPRVGTSFEQLLTEILKTLASLVSFDRFVNPAVSHFLTF